MRTTARYANRQSGPAQTRGFCGFGPHPRYSPGFLGWCSSRRPVEPLPSRCEAEGERLDSFTTQWRSRRGPFVYRPRISAPQAGEAGSIPARITGPIDSPGGGTGRRAGPRSTCPRGVGVRISPRRLGLLQAGRCPAGPHKPGVPGSIPGPGTRGWAGARPSVIRSEAEVRLPDPQLSVSMARYANWHRGQVESLVPVGSNPTRATGRNSSRRLAAKTPVLQTG
jgi:hypothetical protein